MPSYLDFAGLSHFKDKMRGATLEEAVSDFYAIRRTGRVYQVKIPKFVYSSTSVCEKTLDNAGLVCNPSTDTVEGRDDYADIPMFQWSNCNYKRDADGVARLTALEGMDNYQTTGAVDVGVIMPMFYWNYDYDSDENYAYLTISDLPNPKYGLKPWVEGVKADGTVLPYFIGSKYFSGTASDGLLRSQPNLPVEAWQSHNNMMTNYQKKGAGYWGQGVERNTLQIIFTLIKYSTKNSQNIFKGCSPWYWNADATQAETGVKRVIVAASKAGQIKVGCWLRIGTNASTDPGAASSYSISGKGGLKVISKTELESGEFAVNFETATSFDTTETTRIFSIPWGAGSTDSVLGHHDGSLESNTDQAHPYRIQGREYGVGAYSVAGNIVMDANADMSRNVMVAPRGVSHSTSDATIRSTYTNVGTIPAELVTSSWNWIGDIMLDTDTGAWYSIAKGSSDSVGYGDSNYYDKITSGTREYLQGGGLWVGSGCGLVFLGGGGGLGAEGWGCVAAD